MIKECIKVLGITQTELASFLEVSPRTIRGWVFKGKIPNSVTVTIEGWMGLHQQGLPWRPLEKRENMVKFSVWLIKNCVDTQAKNLVKCYPNYKLSPDDNYEDEVLRMFAEVISELLPVRYAKVSDEAQGLRNFPDGLVPKD